MQTVDDSARTAFIMRTIRELKAAVVPLYAARITDLGPGDFPVVESLCGHAERLTARMLATAGAGADDKIANLAPRLRCRECDDRGKVVCRSGGLGS